MFENATCSIKQIPSSHLNLNHIIYSVFVIFNRQIKGYQGLVHCPDRRLCVYADITPPSDVLNTFPASISRQVPL